MESEIIRDGTVDFQLTKSSEFSLQTPMGFRLPHRYIVYRSRSNHYLSSFEGLSNNFKNFTEKNIVNVDVDVIYFKV